MAKSSKPMSLRQQKIIASKRIRNTIDKQLHEKGTSLKEILTNVNTK